MILQLRCTHVTYGQREVEGRPGLTEQGSETAVFGDAEVPLSVLTDRKVCLQVHITDPTLFGRFKVDGVYTFSVE